MWSTSNMRNGNSVLHPLHRPSCYHQPQLTQSKPFSPLPHKDGENFFFCGNLTSLHYPLSDPRLPLQPPSPQFQPMRITFTDSKAVEMDRFLTLQVES